MLCSRHSPGNGTRKAQNKHPNICSAKHARSTPNTCLGRRFPMHSGAELCHTDARNSSVAMCLAKFPHLWPESSQSRPTLGDIGPSSKKFRRTCPRSTFGQLWPEFGKFWPTSSELWQALTKLSPNLAALVQACARSWRWPQICRVEGGGTSGVQPPLVLPGRQLGSSGSFVVGEVLQAGVRLDRPLGPCRQHDIGSHALARLPIVAHLVARLAA